MSHATYCSPETKADRRGNFVEKEKQSLFRLVAKCAAKGAPRRLDTLRLRGESHGLWRVLDPKGNVHRWWVIAFAYAEAVTGEDGRTSMSSHALGPVQFFVGCQSRGAIAYLRLCVIPPRQEYSVILPESDFSKDTYAYPVGDVHLFGWEFTDTEWRSNKAIEPSRG